MKQLIASLILLTSIGITNSCKKASTQTTGATENCISFSQAPVTKVEGAVSAIVNDTVPLTVYFGCYNGCGQFDHFEETVSGTTITINVIAKYTGCICTMDTPVRKAVYTFRPGIPLTYTLLFKQAGNTFFTYTLPVK